MKSTFSIDMSKKDNEIIIALSGEVDMHTCSRLNATLEGAVSSTQGNLILDLSDVNYLDSSGLGVIAYSAKLLADKNYGIIVICDKPHINKIFELSGLCQKNIRLSKTVEEAHQLG